MNDTVPGTIYLKDYTPPPYLVKEIELEVEIFSSYTQIKSRLNILRDEKAFDNQPLELNGVDLELIAVSLNDIPLSEDKYDCTSEYLTLENLPESFVLETVVRIRPQDNTRLEGLYGSKDGLFTQCEAEGFRRITYFIDRPDVMSCYSVTIIADQAEYPILLSNGNLEEEGKRGDGKHWVRWIDPFPKPSYLFALVAGKLDKKEDQFTTFTGKEVTLAFYVEPGKLDQCEFAMEALKSAIRWDEEVFGLELDLDRYMIVAVSDFNMGAMENKGLNIFNTKYVLARSDTATDHDFMMIDRVIAHEYFHNWTGNRVTCRDWFQLSLKEGLTVFRDQRYGEDKYNKAVQRIQEVRILRSAQFPEDAGPMAHPIRPAAYMEISNFYTATVYNKGAEVVRMIHTLLGDSGFRKGMDLYFDRHDGQAVRTEEFVSAMSDANSFDLTQFSLWYHQAGTPIINVESQYDISSNEYTLTFSQESVGADPDTNNLPLHIPIKLGLLNENGEEIQVPIDGHHEVFALRDARQSITFNNIGKPPVPSLLRNFSAPVILKYDYSESDLALLAAHDTDPFNRWEASQKLAVGTILDAILAFQGKRLPDYGQGVINASRMALEMPRTESAYATEILTLPSASYIAEQMETVDPEAILLARTGLRTQIASSLEDRFAEVYMTTDNGSDYDPSANSAGARSLRNISLSYMMELQKSEVRNLCLSQLQNSNNMTDCMAALGALANSESPQRHTALEWFYDKWKTEQLVIDKWFSVQATATLPNTLANVRELMKHPDFDIKNPNRVRSLIGAFCQGNHSHFNAADGSGYYFAAEQICAIDPLNSQIAARLARSFDRWRQFSEQHQSHAKEALLTIKTTNNLSKDTTEVVARALS